MLHPHLPMFFKNRILTAVSCAWGKGILLLGQDSDWSNCWISDIWHLWLDSGWILVFDGSDSSCGSVLDSDRSGGCPGWSWESGSSSCCCAWMLDSDETCGCILDSDVSDVCWDWLWFPDESCGWFDGILNSVGRLYESRCNCLCSSSALWANMMLTFLWWARASSLSFSYSRKHIINN